MARIYNDIWKYGDAKDLSIGRNYKQAYRQNCRSIVVPHGEVVTFYENTDRTGKKSFPFYQGEYSDLTFYNVDQAPGCIHVEKTYLTERDLVEVGYYTTWWSGGKKHHYYMHMKLPVGEHQGAETFWEDKINHIKVPFGTTIELFKDKDKDGSLFFDGTNEKWPQHYALDQYDYAWVVSRLKISTDDWVAAGIRLENQQIIDGDSIEGGTITLNNDSPHETTVTETIRKAVELGKTTEWDIHASVKGTAKYTFGPEMSQGEIGLEVEVGGGYGESHSESKTREVEHQVSAVVSGYGQAKASLIIKTGKMVADAVRLWRNVRTGAEVEEWGRITIEDATETMVTVQGAQWAPNAKTPQLQELPSEFKKAA